MHPVARQWRTRIRENCPSDTPVGKRALLRSVRLSRTWRRILRELTDYSIQSVLEAGCGTGSQLVPLAWRGYRAAGIDSSYTALSRCRETVGLIRKTIGKKLPVFLICADFFEIILKTKYSLVFHRGVVEHFLERADRLLFTKKMFECTENDGYIVSIVPSGSHPCRKRYRDERLGGYNIPEIDYSPARLIEEAKTCGAGRVIVLPHNLMGYLVYLPGNIVTRTFYKFIYLIFQVIPPIFLKESFRCRHAYSFICIARKGAI